MPKKRINGMNFYHEGPFAATIIVQDMAQLNAVYALLGGASLAAVAAADPVAESPKADAAKPSGDSGNGVATAEQISTSSTVAAAQVASPTEDLGVDTGGHPWSPELHASTKTKTKDGYWRMKVGVTRPDDLPGFPVAAGATDTGTSAGSTSTANAGTNSTQSEDVASASAGTATDEDDEFAAFRAADAVGATAPAEIPARTWTDADLSKLCNQAAQKLGDPVPVKELIAEHVPEGEVPHSRGVPADQREAFAQAIEAKAGITFAG
jgi:hypothetical protein